MNQQKPDPTRPRQRRVTAQTQSPSHSTPQPREKHATRPAQNDREGWKAYWEERQQIWRTEPEIDQQRQEELEHYRVIVPDIEKGIYPFKGVELSRADVEWLLATHEQGRGPVYWNDESQRERKGLDLRGTSLQQVNLDNLPLARLQAGLGENEWFKASEEQRMQAGICLQGASLRKTRLEGASLSAAQLEEANLYRAQLKETELAHAQLRKADLYRAQLEITNLSGAHLEGAALRSALLKETYLPDAILSDERRIGPLLADVLWESTNLALVDWSQNPQAPLQMPLAHDRDRAHPRRGTHRWAGR